MGIVKWMKATSWIEIGLEVMLYNRERSIIIQLVVVGGSITDMQSKSISSGIQEIHFSPVGPPSH